MIFVDKNNLGSSFFSSAHGWVGARTRIEFSAIKIKKSFRLREGAAGGEIRYEEKSSNSVHRLVLHHTPDDIDHLSSQAH